MYTITRKNGELEVKNQDEAIVYKASVDSYMLYRNNNDNRIEAAKVKDLKDEDVLISLANAVKIGPVV